MQRSEFEQSGERFQIKLQTTNCICLYYHLTHNSTFGAATRSVLQSNRRPLPRTTSHNKSQQSASVASNKVWQRCDVMTISQIREESDNAWMVPPIATGPFWCQSHLYLYKLTCAEIINIIKPCQYFINRPSTQPKIDSVRFVSVPKNSNYWIFACGIKKRNNCSLVCGAPNNLPSASNVFGHQTTNTGRLATGLSRRSNPIHWSTSKIKAKSIQAIATKDMVIFRKIAFQVERTQVSKLAS